MTFHKYLNNLLAQNKPFVAFNYPNSDVLEVVVQKDDSLNYTTDYSEEGFFMAPFKTSEKTILIPFDKSEIKIFSLIKVVKEVTKPTSKKTILSSSLSQKNYTNTIKKAQEKIQKNEFDKVVLSRQITRSYSQKEAPQVFVRLLKNYPNTFRYLWYHPKKGLWLGATPEILFEIKDSYFETMALAGTQKADEESDLSWGAKEIQEQQYVTDYISKVLSDIKIPLRKSDTFNLKAGDLWHICTKISGKLAIQTELKNIVKALHPTPAVAGLPKQKAIDFILENEQYNRSFYTGFLGVLNKEKESRLFVNLRCMQVKNNEAHVYVGGGITKESIPEAEWQETEDKSQTLLKLL